MQHACFTPQRTVHVKHKAYTFIQSSLIHTYTVLSLEMIIVSATLYSVEYFHFYNKSTGKKVTIMKIFPEFRN